MNIRRFLIVVGILGAFVLVMATLGHLGEILKAFSQARWYVIPLFIVVQIVSYYANAKYYQRFFDIFDHGVPLRYLYEVSLGINFANQTIPSGGVSGTAYLSQALKPYDIAIGKSALAQIGRFAFTFWSFFITLGIGFLILFLTDDLEDISARFVALLMLGIMAVGIVLFTVISERRRLEAFLVPATHFVNWFGRTILRRKKPVLSKPHVEEVLEEFYKGYSEIMSHKRQWPRLLWWAFASIMAEALTVYVIFIGFGQWMNPGLVIAGYALSIIASIAGFFAGGFAVYEAGMIGTFTALGVSFPLSFAVVILYRTLNLVIAIPIGMHFYRQHLKETS
jgi:uncharacterized protein (TIRG00374 family)